MEQDREARDREPVEVWDEAVEAADAAVEAVLGQDLGAIAFAPSAVKEHPINRGAPATSSNAPSAEPL
jgi:hypothetical protein